MAFQHSSRFVHIHMNRVPTTHDSMKLECYFIHHFRADPYCLLLLSLCLQEDQVFSDIVGSAYYVAPVSDDQSHLVSHHNSSHLNTRSTLSYDYCDPCVCVSPWLSLITWHCFFDSRRYSVAHTAKRQTSGAAASCCTSCLAASRHSTEKTRRRFLRRSSASRSTSNLIPGPRSQVCL